MLLGETAFLVPCHVCAYLYRLVKENEVKQWKEQADKMRKGKHRTYITLMSCWFHYKMSLSVTLDTYIHIIYTPN